MRCTVLTAFLLGLGFAGGCFNPKVTSGGFACSMTDNPPCPAAFFCVNGLCQDHPGTSTDVDMSTGTGGNGGGGGGGGGGGMSGGDMARAPGDMVQLPPGDMAGSACGMSGDPCGGGVKCCSGSFCIPFANVCF